jgi:hypothetical protein
MIIYPLPAQELDDVTLSKQVKAIAIVLCEVHHLIHSRAEIPIPFSKIPYKQWIRDYKNWARTCRANYLKLVEMGAECCSEWIYRFIDMYDIDCVIKHRYGHKLNHVIEWCELNIPELPVNNNSIADPIWSIDSSDGYITPFPIVMPDKYIEYISSTVRQGQPKPVDIEQSYRNYYKSKLPKDCIPCNVGGSQESCTCYKSPSWSRRTKPEWLEI